MTRATLVLAAVLTMAAAPAAAETVVHVPGSVPTLSAAFQSVPDGGVIELADGIYPTPVGGWFFANLQKSFTVRAASGATVTLDGSDARPILRLQNTNPALGGQVSFIGLVFTGGFSVQNGVAGGVTIEDNDAIFTDCVFEDNGSDATITGGGGAIVFGEADVRFIGCRFEGNWARNEGGGLKIGEGARAFVHQSVFIENRVNLAGHRPSSAGGGIHVGNADVVVTNSRFKDNQAGYVGGGFYSIGTWQDPVSVPRSNIGIANCTFEDNLAYPYPGITPPSKTEGGAVHAEDQVLMRIDNSRFFTNAAETGGGVNLYRARVEVTNSVFRGNRATAVGGGTGFGGALVAVSNDTSIDGSNNRPSAELSVTDCLIQGTFQQVGSVGQIGGGIYTSGDQNRQYGNNGVPAIPNLTVNRANVTIVRSVFSECQVVQSVVGTGVGGAAMFDLSEVDIDGTVFLASEATGSDSHGGGLRAIGQSSLAVDDSTLAGNTAQRFGGAVYLQGVEANFNGCALIENTDGDNDYGAAIFSGPDEAAGTSMTGAVANSVISNTADRGLLVFDDDRQGSPSTPFNDLRYNGNTIFDRSQGTAVYRDPLAGAAKTASELNNLVVNRTGGTPSTDKAQISNTTPSSAPVVAAIVSAPTVILSQGAAGDPAGATEAFVGYAWTGGAATLDGGSVSGLTGLSSVSVGTHVIDVDGTQDSAVVSSGAVPSATLVAVPVSIASGQQAQLQWSTTGGTFVQADLDHGVTIVSSPSGAVTVSPTVTTTYQLFVLTKEGGTTGEATVFVDEVPGLIFTDGLESGDTAAWDVTAD